MALRIESPKNKIGKESEYVCIRMHSGSFYSIQCWHSESRLEAKISPLERSFRQSQKAKLWRKFLIWHTMQITM